MELCAIKVTQDLNMNTHVHRHVNKHPLTKNSMETEELSKLGQPYFDPEKRRHWGQDGNMGWTGTHKMNG